MARRVTQENKVYPFVRPHCTPNVALVLALLAIGEIVDVKHAWCELQDKRLCQLDRAYTLDAS